MGARNNGADILEDDPLWFKDAIIYEVHVRGFRDSNDDGVGDFRGLIEKLDYLQDLGVTAIWILPFYPSPLRDDGYDIADYTDVNPSYGVLRDVKAFVREAHRRGLRVITELVCNHTSDLHPWFQRARQAKPGSSARDFYVWSDTTDKYKEARIIFKDFETSNWSWDPVAQAYYWHRFYHHQPDLNYDNPRVRRAIFKTMDFWLDMGIDGLRLDAIPYLYEREGTNCENLPETHQFFQELRRHVDERFKNRMLLAEANQWPEDAVSYFGDGDEGHMAFHFPLMPRMFMAIRMEDRYPIVDILSQTPSIPESAQWALFLRNHDELTLEMVTDEERDYMYRIYAHNPQMRVNLGIRRRLAPLMGNHRRRIELMNGLLFSLPGTPVIYYGDEIGMGDNIYLGDRNSVRTPMQWSADRNAGFSRTSAQRLYLPVIVDAEYHYEALNVEAQQNNSHSLLWWMKRLMALRKRYKAFGRGSLEFLHPENRKVLAFIRRYEDEQILVIANLSRFVQCVELDLSAWRDMLPIEMFGRVEFPPIGDLPYFLTLGPHGFYWFSLEPQRTSGDRINGGLPEADLPVLTVAGAWEELLTGKGRSALAGVLPGYLQSRRWFGGKARHITRTKVLDVVPVPNGTGTSGYLTLAEVSYTEGDPDTYLLPLVLAAGERAGQVLAETRHAVVARIRARDNGNEGILYDAMVEPGFNTALLSMIASRRNLRGSDGEITGTRTPVLRQVVGRRQVMLEPSLAKVEQSNTSIIYGDQLILKLFRRLEAGTHPDLEIGHFLTGRSFVHTPPVAGMLTYRRNQSEPVALGFLQGFVPNEGNAWDYTLDTLGDYFERSLATDVVVDTPRISARSLLELAQAGAPPEAHERIGAYLESAWQLGQRTAELHLALAADGKDPSFAPEAFTTFSQRSLYQSMRKLASEVFQTLRKRIEALPETVRPDARRIGELEGEILRRFHVVSRKKVHATRIRVHGDYHLGQLLFTGKDFVIIDFEGEPARSLSERRLKRSPLRDVAGMLRSFHYAADAALVDHGVTGLVRPADATALEPWARFWDLWTSVTFLKAYLECAGEAHFIPQDRDELVMLLDAFLLDKAIYELGYELNNRPDWVTIPVRGLLDLIDEAGGMA